MNGPPPDDWVIDPLTLAQSLLRAPSVTPAPGEIFALIALPLCDLGFSLDRFASGDAPDGPVENLLATRTGTGPCLAFAGHLDVVPPGGGWTTSPWSGDIRGDFLYSRGAVDMKGAIAAFIAAIAKAKRSGPLVLVITGDEEGPAIFGTRALIDRMAERTIVPDYCVVGEPTSAEQLGDTVKIGRRGSVNIWITVPGRQGHVAYPDLADNPITRLIAALADIQSVILDAGNSWFQPSNMEVTDLAVGNPAHNVIPAEARARISIRFNDEQRGSDLIDRIASIVRRHAPAAQITGRVSGEAFLTEPGPLSTLLAAAITETTGITPELSTTGGTSDARFLSKICPTCEFGLPNATMHQVDEAVAIADLHNLTAIYANLIERVAAL